MIQRLCEHVTVLQALSLLLLPLLWFFFPQYMPWGGVREQVLCNVAIWSEPCAKKFKSLYDSMLGMAQTLTDP